VVFLTGLGQEDHSGFVRVESRVGTRL